MDPAEFNKPKLSGEEDVEIDFNKGLFSDDEEEEDNFDEIKNRIDEL